MAEEDLEMRALSNRGKLRACPFCGSKAALVRQNLTTDKVNIYPVCPKCKAIILAPGLTEAGATKAWNRRTKRPNEEPVE